MELIKNLEITSVEVPCFVNRGIPPKIMHKSVSLITYIYNVSCGLKQTFHWLLVVFFFLSDNTKWQEEALLSFLKKGREIHSSEWFTLIVSGGAVFKIIEIQAYFKYSKWGKTNSIVATFGKLRSLL